MTSESKYLPYIYGIAANVFFTLVQFLMKLQATVISPATLVYYRSFIMLTINTYLIYRENFFRKISRKQSPSNIQHENPIRSASEGQIEMNVRNRDTLKYLLLRILFAVISILTLAEAIKVGEMSIVLALFQTAPIFVFFIEAFLHKTPLSRIHFLLTVISFVGVAIILAPKAESESQSHSPQLQDSRLTDYIYPLISAFTSAGSMAFVHVLSKKCHSTITMQYLNIGAIFICGIIMTFWNEHSVHQNPQEINVSTHKYFDSSTSVIFIGSIIMTGTFNFLSQHFKIKALYTLSASKITPLHYIGIIGSILFDLFFFGYQIFWYQYIGILLACSGLFTKIFLELSEPKNDSH